VSRKARRFRPHDSFTHRWSGCRRRQLQHRRRQYPFGNRTSSGPRGWVSPLHRWSRCRNAIGHAAEERRGGRRDGNYYRGRRKLRSQASASSWRASTRPSSQRWMTNRARPHSKAAERAPRVRPDVRFATRWDLSDAGADLAQFGGLFEDRTSKPERLSRQRCGEAADPARPDNDDSHFSARILACVLSLNPSRARASIATVGRIARCRERLLWTLHNTESEQHLSAGRTAIARFSFCRQPRWKIGVSARADHRP